MGNVLFFINCLGTALYVIVVKVAFRRGYPPSTVTAWSYLAGAVMMACVATGFSSDCALVQFVCPPPSNASSSSSLSSPTFTCGEYETSCEPWAVPESAVLPLCYWVAFNSCVACASARPTAGPPRCRAPPDGAPACRGAQTGC